MNKANEHKSVIAVLGGTGNLGGGLAYRWAKAGYRIIIGSRNEGRAIKAAADIKSRVASANVVGMDNVNAASSAEIVASSVPFSHQRMTLESIREAVQGKLFIDTTVCLVPPKVGTVQLPPEGSAGIIAQDLLGENVRVVSAFQNIAADHLNGDHPIDCDVLVCGNNKEARSTVIGLAEAAGMKGWHAGPIANSAVTEGLTSVLITIIRQHKIKGAGIIVTGEAKTADE